MVRFRGSWAKDHIYVLWYVLSKHIIHMNRSRSHRFAIAILASVLVIASTAGPVAAEARSGGTIIVAEGETVNQDLDTFGGQVTVRGTVNGDLNAFGGDVAIADTGVVTGDVRAFGGSVTIEQGARIGGDFETAGGAIVIEGTVDGDAEIAAGSATIDGRINGDVEVVADEVTVGQSAVIGGDLEYDAGTFTRQPGAVVRGSVTRNPDMATGPGVADVRPPVVAVPNWAGAVFGFFVNLLLGAVLLIVVPRFSRDVAARVIDSPLRTGGVGFIVAIAIPIVLVLVAITIIGIPLALVGALLAAIVSWIAAVYGQFAVGTWLLSLADGSNGNRWASLLLGVLLVSLLGLVPILGGIVQLLVSLLGLGALALCLRARRRGRSRTAEPASDAGTGVT